MKVTHKVKQILSSILEKYGYVTKEKESTIPHSAPSFLSGYWQDAFNLKQHLQGFLQIDSETLENKLQSGQQELATLGHHDFDWEKATEFYRDQVKDAYLFDLGMWHLTDQEQIGGALQLIADHAQGRVLDFGGGIGTHTIGAALCPQVQQVVYCDINPVSLDFVKYRVMQMELQNKVFCCDGKLPESHFDTIICLDVLEHLPDPSDQLSKFHKILSPNGKMIVNWWFSQGYNQQFSFHLDDPQLIEAFFLNLQQNFLEVFNPYSSKSRCYRKI